MKRRTLIIVSVVVVGLIVVGALVWQNFNSRPTASAASVQTSQVRRGTLVATISAAGNVSAINEVALPFQTSGRVASVPVQVGDAVKAGQVLMQLDTTDLELALKTTQTSLASTQASYDQTKADLDYALRNTQSALTTAKANLDAAKAKNDQNPNSLIIAKASLDKATVTLQQAQANYNRIAWRGDVSATSEAATLQTATIDYQTALANYKVTEATINDSAYKSAQEQYSNAQISLEQAQKNLDTKMRSAQAQLDNAKVSVEQAKRNLDKAFVYAPFDGVVSVVNFKKGDTAGTTTAVTVVDTSRLQIKVSVAEVDLPKVKVGASSQVNLDALPGKNYQAKVTTVGPVGTVTQGVVNYPVTLEVTNVDKSVSPGMTANLTIVVESRENVLYVPLRAVRTQGTQKSVTVQYKGQSIAVSVTTGLTNDQAVELLSGELQEGDVVVINQTTTRQTTNIPGGGPGIPFIGR
ncbi:MAG: efflux RND transporter periplasmic adaptor subunit [Chloroflexi bacterium]|nr:efflux RND transporter periplasmic adaptor subunit [Chloroflexota bacterium]